MSETVTLEFNSEQLHKKVEYDLFVQAETQLKKLARGHSDITGAAVNVRRPAHGETTPLFEVTVVVYGRPDHIAATQKKSEPSLALSAALDAVERQIRERRDKLKKHWQQPGNTAAEQEIRTVIAAEAGEDGDPRKN